MALLHEDKDRRVIPRWRQFSEAQELGEVTSLGSSDRTGEIQKAGNPDFQLRLTDWQEQRTAGVAADLLSSAMVLGRLEEARGAAELILSTTEPSLQGARIIARR